MEKAMLIAILLVIPLISANQEICNGFYNFILSNTYDYTDAEFMDLASQLNISLENLTEYKYNYNSLCLNYEERLPKQTFPTLIIYKNNTECEIKNSLLSSGIKIFEINLGEISCEKANNFNYFFQVEKREDSFVINKIKLFSIFVLVILLFLIMVLIFWKREKGVNKLIR